MRVDAGSKQRPFQPSRHRQNRIAYRLSIQTACRVVMQQTVARIELRIRHNGCARLSKSLAQNDSADEPFDRPAILDEFRGEAVEQFRMRRRHAHVAEIVGGRDDASTEKMMPDAIDDHSGRQWIVGAGDQFREFTATAA